MSHEKIENEKMKTRECKKNHQFILILKEKINQNNCHLRDIDCVYHARNAFALSNSIIETICFRTLISSKSFRAVAICLLRLLLNHQLLRDRELRAEAPV